MELENRDYLTVIKKVFTDTVLETEEGNQLAICMRDDTIEMSVVGSDVWYRADMKTGNIEVL